MTNPLDDLQQFSQSDLPRQHSCGRRELRQQQLANGIRLRVQPRSVEDKLKAVVGEWIDSAPIRRTEPKGLTKKQRNKLKKASRSY